jgi:hypothetical protein
VSGSYENLPSNGTLVLKGGSTNGALPTKDYIVKATVEWNDNLK